MKCDDIEILISAYIDDEVTGEEKHIVEEHLRTCKNCRDTLTDFSDLHSLFGELEAKEAVRGFRQRVTERIDAQPRLEWSWRRVSRLAYALCFSLLILLGGTVLSLYIDKTPLISPQNGEQTVVEIDVYAEDFLFEQSSSTEFDLFSSATTETSIGEEILDDTFDFTETDTSWVDEERRLVI